MNLNDALATRGVQAVQQFDAFADFVATGGDFAELTQPFCKPVSHLRKGCTVQRLVADSGDASWLSGGGGNRFKC